jgi:hypothetical protein
MKETKSQILNRLFSDYGLTKDDWFEHKFYKIITRSGIDKIQGKANITINYDVVQLSSDMKHCLVKAVAVMRDKDNNVLRTCETFGECAPYNNSNSYPVAMSEKRAMSRAVLKLAGFYELGVFSEDESGDFKKEPKVKKDSKKKPVLTDSALSKIEELLNDKKFEQVRKGLDLYLIPNDKDEEINNLFKKYNQKWREQSS